MFQSDSFTITIEKIVRTFHQRNVARPCVVYRSDQIIPAVVYTTYGGCDQEDCEDIVVYSGD